MPVTRTMARDQPSLFSPPPAAAAGGGGGAAAASPTSPYSLSNEDMHQLTEEYDRGAEELTTSGRTYEELVRASQQRPSSSNQPRDSMMSEETEESDEGHPRPGRQSVGFMLGRNSLSNWSVIGGGPTQSNDEEIPSSVGIEHLNTGRKSNVSRHSLGRASLGMETPNALGAGHVNVSNRRSAHVNDSRGPRSNAGTARLSHPSGARRSNPLNLSHISSSSSSGMEASRESLMGDSWSPIRTSLENSFAKNVVASGLKSSPTNQSRAASIGQKRNGSLSPIRGRSSRSLSPKKRSPAKENPNGAYPSPKRSPARSQSPTRSPLGDLSPNHQRGTLTSPKKKALSPNGTYSLREAEGARLSMPVARSSPMVESGSSNSGMSVCSGSDTAASSATLLSQSSRKKVALPSLGSMRKASPAMRKAPPKETVTESASGPSRREAEKAAETMLSPDKGVAKNHERSPAPTPNSQRRVIKRFRASIPTANYLMPEDAMEDSVETNPMRSKAAAAKPVPSTHREETVKANAMEVEATTEASTKYENAFEFPADSIPLPWTKTLRNFRNEAVAMGSPSHQYQLDRAGTNLLSLQEVILPAIAAETTAVLKQKQAVAQRNVKDGLPASQGKEVVEAIETCRKVVKRCTGEAMKVLGESWRAREKEQEQLRSERVEKEAEQRRLDEKKAKEERKKARAKSRQERYERQRLQKKRSHPRNKELWQEVAKLMHDIQKLEKEERLWKEALVEVNKMQEHQQPPARMELDGVVAKESPLADEVEKAGVESTATTLVEDVTMATERINWMLNSVGLAMEESDRLRKEAFDKYQYDGHKLYGYPKADDPKELFMALSMESPLRRE